MEKGDKKSSSSCGLLILYNAFFRRRSASAPASPSSSSANADPLPARNSHNSNRRRPVAAVSSKPAPPRIAANKPYRPSAGRGRGSMPIDLDSMIYDHQRAKGSSMLVRASSGNVMLHSNLGNLRAPNAVAPNRNVLDYLPKTAKEIEMDASKGGGGGGGGVAMCRALSRRVEPEELKEMGNEEYKKGRYAEALALYERAILIDPNKASYWSDKAAAMIGLGLLLEALQECKQAVKIDPCYFRAHHRLANLYLR